jgi:hypothetical protein
MKLKRTSIGLVLVVVLVSASIGALLAQAPAASSAGQNPAQKVLTPLKITVVISRYQGDKKTASLPFTLWVNANDRHDTSLRMNQQVAVPQNTFAPAGATAPNQLSFSYRSVGTNIDSSAEAIDDGRFTVQLKIEDSQLFSDTSKGGVGASGMPSFQSFSSSMNVILKDGQTAQYTTATDKITGEVIKVDVTLNAIK